LGSAATAAKIEIAWPGGARQVLANIKADQTIQVTEPN